MRKYEGWQHFWDKYLYNRFGKDDVETEADLYRQVARTINRMPVERKIIDLITDQIYNDLSLSVADVLVDLCCGNGLFTYELRNYVLQIAGVDFSQNIIDAANKFRHSPNITYELGDVVHYLETFHNTHNGIIPTKYLMNDSLAYFSPADLESMLKHMVATSGNFKFLARGAPNDELKWNYYNTDERKESYKRLLAEGDLTNDGLGRWWLSDEITGICKNLKLNCTIKNQTLPISDYRMDITISNY